MIEYRNLMVGEGKLDLIYLVTILSKKSNGAETTLQV
jgi:hypothetical protein